MSVAAGREGRGPGVQEARGDQCCAGAGRLQEFLLAGAHDEVEDDVGAGPAGVAAGGFGDVLVVGGDDRGGAGGEQVAFFAVCRVTAMGTAPIWLAICIAARPTPPDAAVMRTWSPGRIPAFSTSAP